MVEDAYTSDVARRTDSQSVSPDAEMPCRRDGADVSAGSSTLAIMVVKISVTRIEIASHMQ